ncbi:protein kinase domain-containing protein [Glycomyces albidus]|uniref:Protein kinase domain-containing protein n=1 Tax=Glycomyces albidus TaxID=2656774 RepID=A0A6L5G1L2_9ACTN|nr:hypothetical protein [Glycomyces albidus]MQM24062.1 hypothetical protein [Glycomyces albidus]
MPTQHEILTAAIDGLAGGGDPAAAAALDRWDPSHWRSVLLDLPLDERGYRDRFLIDQDAEIVRLWRWWTADGGPDRPAQTAGYLGFYLLTIVALHCSERARFHGETDVRFAVGEETVTAARISAGLVADPRVRRAVQVLYDPAFGSEPATEETLAEWEKIDFDSLRFHRHGTTSVILYGRSAKPKASRHTEFAFKCLIYPYRQQPPIVAATRAYASRFEGFIPDDAPLVGVWASHDGWILMDFLKGETLADRLRSRPKAETKPRKTVVRPVDIAELDVLGSALLHALADLERLDYRHEDLSPSNIVVQSVGGGTRIRFIDLGVNHLHTRMLPGEAYGEAVYVAPEVRKGGGGDGQADLYSLGRILLAISGAELRPDGSLPDHSYVLSTGMARLLEDLVDADPGRRLLVTPIEEHDPVHGQDRNRIDQIRELFEREMAVIREAARLEPEGALEKARSLLPGSGTVSRQGRILRVRKRQAAELRRRGLAADVPRLRKAQRLHRWAWAAAFVLWGTAALVATWWVEDLGVGWQAKGIEMVNIAIAQTGSDFDFFAAMRLDGYDMPDPWENLPARLVGFSFALVNARLYLNLFAEISPLSPLPRRGRRRFLTWATEFGLRSMAVLPSLCVLIPTLLQGDWWPLATQIGLVWTAIVFTVFIAFERDTHRRAREAGLSTVPEGEFPPGRLVRWRPTLLIYCATVLVMGTLIMLDLVQDELVYACFVSLINLSIYYFKSAGADAPRVRTELSRAFLAAERLDHLEARRRAAAAAGPRTPSEGAPHADAGPAVDAVGGLAVADRA